VSRNGADGIFGLQNDSIIATGRASARLRHVAPCAKT
jgi:hypothetical protein